MRAELDRLVCANWIGDVQVWNVGFMAQDCGRPWTEEPLLLACEASIARVKPLLLLARVFEDKFYGVLDKQAPTSRDIADQLARDAFWQDPLLARATWIAVGEELRARGLRCEDCPSSPESSRVEVSWAEFLPYLNAYVWPVQSEVDGKIEVFTCSGINGAAALTGDPQLVQAGFLAAAGLAGHEEFGGQVRKIADAGRSTAEVTPALQRLLESPAVRSLCITVLVASLRSRRSS